MFAIQIWWMPEDKPKCMLDYEKKRCCRVLVVRVRTLFVISTEQAIVGGNGSGRMARVNMSTSSV